MIWNPDAEPREALKEALLRGYGHLAYEDVEKITETLSGMDWHLVPGGQLRRLLGDSAQLAAAGTADERTQIRELRAEIGRMGERDAVQAGRICELEGEVKRLQDELTRRLPADDPVAADELTAAIEDADRPASVPVSESDERVGGGVQPWSSDDEIAASMAPSPVPEEPEGRKETFVEAFKRHYDAIKPAFEEVTNTALKLVERHVGEAWADGYGIGLGDGREIRPTPVPVEEPEGRSPKDVEDAPRYAKSAMVAAVPPSPAPESYDKHAGSPDSPQDRHNSAPEIKVGQEWRSRDSGAVAEVTDVQPGQVEFGFPDDPEHSWRVSSEARFRSDFDPVLPPAPSLNPEGLAWLDAEIDKLGATAEGSGLDALAASVMHDALWEARSRLVSTPSEEAESE